MQLVLVAIFFLVVHVSALTPVERLVGYHERVGIPAAKRVKASEDAILAKKDSRIVGGAVAEPNEYPYLAGLLVSFVDHPGISLCGATLLSSDRLVTAAHCWNDGRHQALRFVVVLGSNFLFTGGIRVPSWIVVTHPAWEPSTLQNNVAVVYLATAVTLTDSIQPVSLPTDYLEESFDGEWAVAVGYGKTNDEQTGISGNAAVNAVTLQVMSLEQCQAVYGSWVQPTNICTDGSGGVGICAGDNGGPLVVTRDEERVLIGISSFSAATGCEAGFPSAFSRITSFYDFITLHLAQ